MVIVKALNPRPQYRSSWFAPKEMLKEVAASTPGFAPGCVNGYEDIKQVLNIHVLRRDPSRFSKPRPIRVKRELITGGSNDAPLRQTASSSQKSESETHLRYAHSLKHTLIFIHTTSTPTVY